MTSLKQVVGVSNLAGQDNLLTFATLLQQLEPVHLVAAYDRQSAFAVGEVTAVGVLVDHPHVIATAGAKHGGELVHRHSRSVVQVDHFHHTGSVLKAARDLSEIRNRPNSFL
ncbi:hypothetical protein [Rhodococcoides fascians]|uniref:hypothetical protein n=1 Tax=Rhodococcoides fascians TaxID=1828 RepID=UPI0011A71979|nr:hypothetical protein [Rhodococcus fascians]